jgi:hypothetical protein
LSIFNRLYDRLGLHTAAEGTYVRDVDNVLRILAGKRRRRVSPMVRKDPAALNVLSLDGIGDVLWSALYIPALLRKRGKSDLRLVVHFNGDHRSGRSFDLLRRLDYVKEVVPFAFRIHRPVAVKEDGYLDYTFAAGPADEAGAEVFDFALIVNTFLEHGWSVEQIARHLDLDETLVDWRPFDHFEWKPQDTEIAQSLTRELGKYVVFYLGAEVDNTTSGLNCGGLWSPTDWVKLFRLVAASTGMKIVVIGAPYDLSYFKDVVAAGPTDVLSHSINMIGLMDLPGTLATMKEAEFVVGFASGMPISSTYLRTRTAIFWRPQELSMSPHLKKYGFHEHFATNWVPPDMLASESYLDLWYSKDTPESVMDRMKRARWF